MRTFLALATLVLSIPVLVTGCRHHSTAPAEDRAPLEWVEKGIVHEGFTIALGYRGKGLNADRKLEPVAAITCDGKPVASAMVFNRLVSADGSEMIGDEVATVYEASPGLDSALYAQGTLHVPEANSPCVVRFRIILPHADQEWVRDIRIPSQ